MYFDGILQSDKSQYKLAEDYQKRVSQSAIPHFDQMLSFLCDTNGVRQLDAPYNRICRTEAFENYFYAQSGFEHGTGLGELLEFPSRNYAKVAEILRNSDARANIQASKRKEGGRVSKSVVEKGNKKKAISL